jgi:hypothetical protein
VDHDFDGPPFSTAALEAYDINLVDLCKRADV